MGLFCRVDVFNDGRPTNRDPAQDVADASARLWLYTAPTMIATSGRFVAIARNTAPPIPSPQPKCASIASVVAATIPAAHQISRPAAR
jgi:hypothetical protein